MDGGHRTAHVELHPHVEPFFASAVLRSGLPVRRATRQSIMNRTRVISISGIALCATVLVKATAAAQSGPPVADRGRSHGAGPVDGDRRAGRRRPDARRRCAGRSGLAPGAGDHGVLAGAARRRPAGVGDHRSADALHRRHALRRRRLLRPRPVVDRRVGLAPGFAARRQRQLSDDLRLFGFKPASVRTTS